MKRDRELFAVTHEPRGALYDELLDWAGGRADRGCVVVRPDLGLAAAAETLLAELSPYVVSESEVSEWPGTQLLGGEAACFRVFEVKPEVIALLKRAGRGLYEWQQPDLPEDLCFLEGELPIVTTIAHERACYLRLSREQLKDLKNHFPALGSALVPG